MIEDKELAQLFKAESAEHLARLDDGLLRLEKTPVDQSLLEEVFRESHSLKGAARMLGLSKIEIAAHGLESILNTARKGETPLTPDVIERMTVVLGELRQLVQEALTDSDGGPQDRAEQEALKSEEAGRALPIAEAKTAALQNAEPDVPQSAIANSQLDIPQSELHTQHSDEPLRIETVRVETRKLDDLLTLVGELSVIEGRTQHRLLLMDTLLEQWAMLERSRSKLQSMLRGTEIGAKTSEALHAEGEMLTRLGGRIKEARTAFFEDGARLETTVKTLEERVHAARLLPLSTVFALFPRMVHDLARQQSKEVELLIEGGEIGVDKRIIEEMKDPLMHLLRNAIDHGIELPPEREQQGKPHVGTLRLRAVRESNTVLLEVSDDGRGLDLAAIRQVALQRGLYDEARLAAMPSAQLQQLVFVPGFSTNAFITDLSGRGVGLDVVRVNVGRLKGDIRMESVPQQGTVMQVRLPLSLTTTRLLLVSVCERLYGLPIEFVHSSRRLQREDIFTLEGRHTINLDGQPVIAPRLADLLSLPEENQGGETVCIVIQVDNERLALRVEELLDEEEVVAKPLGVPLTRVRNVSGLTILGSGDICAVLNPSDLLRTAHQMNLVTPQSTLSTLHSNATFGARKEIARAGILLVEDSALVRAMEKRILEEAGYEVVAAVDGVDALNALGRHSFSAVVSDIVMPNMDGLTLTARIRQEQCYKDLPIILVTSLATDEDKRRGLEAGANAYLPKPSFDQRALLETLKRLI